MAAASAARHDTRALLRAHLAAASRYGHLTRHCVVCHRLLRLVMELPEHEEQEPEREPATSSTTEDESPTDP